MAESQWLTTEEAAGIMGVTPRTINNLLIRGELAGYKFGRVWRISIHDFHNYLSDARNRPSPEKKIVLHWPTDSLMDILAKLDYSKADALEAARVRVEATEPFRPFAHRFTAEMKQRFIELLPYYGDPRIAAFQVLREYVLDREDAADEP